MTEPRPSRITAGRYVWTALSVLVLMALVLSLQLSASSVDGAEETARDRAVQIATTTMSNAVPPRVTSGDIVGGARRDLLDLMRSRVLDDQVARVLIWTPDGELIFSSATGQDLSETISSDDLQFTQAAAGATAAVVVEAIESTGRLHRTFVPLRPPDGSPPYAVVQIDQRYSPIEADANRIWRPVQIALLAMLVVLGGLFALSFRRGRSPVAVAQAAPPGRDDAILEERLRQAEAAAREATERLVTAERQIRDASTLQVPATVVAQVDELEKQVEAERAERERSDAEVQRLRSELDAKNADLEANRAELEANAAELTRAKEVTHTKDEGLARSWDEVRAAVDAETARSAEVVATSKKRADEAEARRAEAERRAEQAELRVADATQRLAVTEQRVSQLEAALRQAQERPALPGPPVEVPRRDDKRAAKELRTVQQEADSLKKKLTQTEASLADATSKLAKAEKALAEVSTKRPQPEAVPASGASGLEIEVLRAERDVAKADLLRAQQELERLKAETGAIE